MTLQKRKYFLVNFKDDPELKTGDLYFRLGFTEMPSLKLTKESLSSMAPPSWICTPALAVAERV
jgi:hypothetical protein